MFRAVMCAAGPEQMLADASFAVDQEPPWSPWRDTALCFCAEAHLLTGDVDQAAALFAEASTLAADDVQHRLVVDSEAELALLAMDRGQWAEAAEHLDRGARRHRRAPDARLRHERARLRRRGPARCAPRRPERRPTASSRGPCGPARSCTFALPWLAVRVRLQLAKVYWAIADQATARHLLREIDDVLLHRPALGALVDEVSAVPPARSPRAPQVGATGGSPLTPAELRLLPYLQTHLTIREIAERLFVSRNTVNSQVSSIYRKLGVSSRNEAVQQATAIGSARRVAGSPSGVGSKASSMS